ncbi:hypothetical protein NPIL_496441 [Nephila pilipes]|uniref:Uncharacterized protein n=1 Tax=Nephila pilipes TaxID=299642 RepID=A0A8X6Q702_NEPPI|nr:hypothetical protein NPIL_496441 [Nephila pilipes]
MISLLPICIGILIKAACLLRDKRNEPMDKYHLRTCGALYGKIIEILGGERTYGTITSGYLKNPSHWGENTLFSAA